MRTLATAYLSLFGLLLSAQWLSAQETPSPQATQVSYQPHTLHPGLLRSELVQLTRKQMKQTAQSLLTLARRHQEESSPESYRATAQLLALSQRLNPQNQRIEQLSTALAAGEIIPHSAQKECAQAVQQLSALISLLQEERNEESKQLAALILDPLSQIAPNHQATKWHTPGASHSRWNLSIAPLEKFQALPKTLPKATANDTTAQTTPQTTAQTPQKTDLATAPSDTEETPAPKEPRTDFIKHPSLSAKTIISGFIESEQSEIKIVELTLDLKAQPESDSSVFKTQKQGSLLAKLISRQQLESLLETHGHPNINPFEATYGFQYRLAKRHPYFTPQSTTALLLLMAGQEAPPAENLIILGQLSNNQDLTPFDHDWLMLRKLRGLKGHRVILPKGSLDSLKSFIPLEETEFFFENEILEASTLQEALLLSSAEFTQPAHAEAIQLFREFLDLAKEKDVKDLLSNSHVRDRFKKIKGLMPPLINTDLIYLNHSSSRASSLSEKVFLTEYNHLLSTLQPLVQNSRYYFDKPKKLQKISHNFSASAKALDKATPSSLETLYRKLEKLADELEDFSQAISKIRNDLYRKYRDNLEASEKFTERYLETTTAFNKEHSEYSKENANP